MTESQNNQNKISSDSKASVSESLMKEIEQGYVCPADAGPAWRSAISAGIDMALIEDALRLSPAERLKEHQRALDALLALQGKSVADDSAS